MPKSNGTSLTISLLHQGTVYDDVLAELLQQQGVPFRVFTKEETPPGGPITLLSRPTPEAVALASESQKGRREDVLVGQDIVDLEAVRRLLGGLQDQKRDLHELPVNHAGRQLVASIAKRMSENALPLVLKPFWPSSARACCVLTHDIDYLVFSPFHKVIWRNLERPSRFPGLLFNGALRRTNYGWNIPETVELEKRYGVRSTFLFMNKYTETEEAYFKKSLKLVREAGSEIALHASDSSHRTMESMNEEMETFRDRVGSYPRGLRHHILKFNAPETWVIESKFRLEYDATFGYNRFFGFRAGSCLPFHPFGPRERLPILELPTGFMDWTALHRSRDMSGFGDFLRLAKERVEEFHGALVVNFHNTYLNRQTFPSVLEEYESLLREVTEKKYWVATASECAAWWRARSLEQVEPKMNEDGTVVVKTSQVSAETFDPKDMSRLTFVREAVSPPGLGQTA